MPQRRAQCGSGEVKAGGCSLLLAGAALEGLGAKFGGKLETIGLEGKALTKAAVATAGATYATSRGAEKLAETSR
jgi:hypothetical protein